MSGGLCLLYYSLYFTTRLMAIIIDYKDRYFGVFADNHNITMGHDGNGGR